jgi:periplasmic protein TonB
MKSQVRAFQISFLLHSLLLVAALLLSSQMVSSKKLMVLDFNLYKPEPSVKKVEAPPPVPKREPIRPKALPTPRNEPLKAAEEKPDRPSAAEIPPMIKLPEAQSQGGPSMGLGMVPSSPSINEGASGIAGGSKEGSTLGTGEGSSDSGKESAKARYFKEHFTYIRDKVLKNISYPAIARRMGWQGKVILSFIIAADGSVREVKIVQSSGFSVLDKNAFETVKDTAPFPKPPVEAKLIMPIVFRLD